MVADTNNINASVGRSTNNIRPKHSSVAIHLCIILMLDFQNLQKVENPDFYLDVAFSQASRTADEFREKKNFKTLNIIKKSQFVELERISTVTEVLSKKLNHVVTSFPNTVDLPEFYFELIQSSFDYAKLKESFAAINWAVKRIKILFSDYKGRILQCRDPRTMSKIRAAFYGRVSSVVKQIGPNLTFLENARRIWRKFPVIRTDVKTIVIAGFPNVGKTTLLSKLTGSEPEIAPYPFTTKDLMIGYTKINKQDIQVIDTPGLLDRPLKSRNNIELKSILALKHLANKILFVMDISETCGYTLDEQKKLLNEIKKLFNTEIIIIINKTDLVNQGDLSRFQKEFPKSVFISAIKGKDVRIIKNVL